MRRVSDAEEAGPVPFAQSIHLNRQQLDVVPIAELADAILQERIHLHYVGTEGLDTATLNLPEPAFGDNERALPVVTAIEHHENPSEIDAAEQLLGIAGSLR